jgi:hypothetical protein
LCLLTLNSQLYLGIFFLFKLNWDIRFLYMRVLEIIWKIFFYSFSYFFCVKHPDGVSGCSDCKVSSSGRPFSLSGRACLCDLLHGTTSGRHLSSVWTVNPVGLNRFPLGAARHCSPSFCSFCHLVRFPYDFYANFSHAHTFFMISVLPRYDFFSFLLFSHQFYAYNSYF